MAAIYDNIYRFAPISFQNVMISAYGWRLMKQRYGASYHAAAEHFLSKKYGSLEAELATQLDETRNLIAFAKANSPFYADLYKGIDVSDIQTIDDLAVLPIVSKEMFRANLDKIYTVSTADGVESFTGGTTGKSLRVLFTQKDFQTRMAYLDTYKTRIGIDPFQSRKATFSGRVLTSGFFQGNRKIFWRKNAFYNQRLYSTFDLTDKKLPYYIKDLNAYKPEVLNGFVSAIYSVAKHIVDKRIGLSFQPKAVFTTSETLLPHHRETIERAFSTRVFDQYASGEGAPFITECLFGNLHYNLDTGVIEVPNDRDGGGMLVTSFTTYGTPLIRYQIGDNITFGSGACKCGSCNPVVDRIEGRSVDFLYSKERGQVSLSQLADVIKGLPNSVKELQFVQEKLDRITIKLVIDEALYTEQSDEIIMEAMRQRFGYKVLFKVQHVSVIDREASGKFSLIKNLLDQNMSPGVNSL